MDARILRLSVIFLSLFAFTGATYHTPNFTVTAANEDIARRVGVAAERYRRDLAEFWLERKLPDWSRPCKLRVRAGALGAGGETKFQFVRGEVLNWDMYVQGSLERILDSVLPHEVNHTIFACHYRRPLPRWADEGAATLFEHRSEQLKQLGLLKQVIKSDREFISLGRLLQMKEYPKGYRPMLIMYAEGYALADFLVQQGGRQKYMKLLAEGERIGWTKAIRDNYHHEGVAALEKNWKAWILAGMPKLRTPSQQQLVAEASGLSDSFRPAILLEYVPGRKTVRLQSRADQGSTQQKRTRSRQDAVPAVAKIRPAARGKAVPRKSTPATVASSSVGSSVFRGMPGARRLSSERTHRAASFEAPAPDNVKSVQRSPSRAEGIETRSSRTETSTSFSKDQTGFLRNGLERTAHAAAADNPPEFDTGKHLPRKRRLVTGSVPQWAGFPGQKELF